VIISFRNRIKNGTRGKLQRRRFSRGFFCLRFAALVHMLAKNEWRLCISIKITVVAAEGADVMTQVVENNFMRISEHDKETVKLRVTQFLRDNENSRHYCQW